MACNTDCTNPVYTHSPYLLPLTASYAPFKKIVELLSSRTVSLTHKTVDCIASWILVFNPTSQSTVKFHAKWKDFGLFLKIIHLPEKTWTLLTHIVDNPPAACKAGADVTETLCKLAIRTACFSTKVLAKISIVGSTASLCKGTIKACEIIYSWQQEEPLEATEHLLYLSRLALECIDITFTSLALASVFSAPWILAAYGTSKLFFTAIGV